MRGTVRLHRIYRSRNEVAHLRARERHALLARGPSAAFTGGAGSRVGEVDRPRSPRGQGQCSRGTVRRNGAGARGPLDLTPRLPISRAPANMVAAGGDAP